MSTWSTWHLWVLMTAFSSDHDLNTPFENQLQEETWAQELLLLWLPEPDWVRLLLLRENLTLIVVDACQFIMFRVFAVLEFKDPSKKNVVVPSPQ